MSTLARVTLLAMVPAHLLVVMWVWAGRVVFGVAGWFLLILMVTLVPLLLIAFAVTTVLAYTQPGRPRALTPLQTVAQLVVWAALVVMGAFMPDFGDTAESTTSLLTELLGYSDSVYNAGFAIATAAGLVAAAAYAVLLGALTLGRRPASNLAAAAPHPPRAPHSPAAPPWIH